MTPLEKAARAAAEAAGRDWDDLGPMLQAEHLAVARAVLLTVRDPGDPAREAYFETCRRHGFRAHINASCAMETMIDAILSEEA